MILIAAIDDQNGMTFHDRRQSQDRVLRQQILSITAGKMLWMDHYSARQFEKLGSWQATIDDAYLSKAVAGDYCFMERLPASFCEGTIEQIILFRWNRRYPGDTFFPIELKAPAWQLISTEDFVGYSHEKITKEVWNHAAKQ